MLDLENYRAAIEWGLAGVGDSAAAAIVASLRWWWFVRARREGKMLLARAAAVLAHDAPARTRGLLVLAATPLRNTGAQAADAANAACVLAGGVDERGRTEALVFQGAAFGREGRLAESLALSEEALAAARATRTPRLIGWTLTQVAYSIGVAGDRPRAHALFDEAAVLLRTCNDQWLLAGLHGNKAELLCAEGDLLGALACTRDAEVLLRERGAVVDLSAALLNAAAYLLVLTRLDEAWAAATESLELALRADDAQWTAIAIGHMAHLGAETCDATRAARLLGYADEFYRRLGNPREPTEQRGYDRALELIRATLPEHRIRTLMAEGAAMEQDAAVTEAMAIPQPPAS